MSKNTADAEVHAVHWEQDRVLLVDAHLAVGAQVIEATRGVVGARRERVPVWVETDTANLFVVV
jgi:hypothetical protein